MISQKLMNVGDPVIDAIIKCKFNAINAIIDEYVGRGGRNDEVNRLNIEDFENGWAQTDSRFLCCGMGLDPMYLETQIAAKRDREGIATNEKNGSGSVGLREGGDSDIGGSVSSDSCPFPPGFEPISLKTQVPHEIRSSITQEIVREIEAECENEIPRPNVLQPLLSVENYANTVGHEVLGYDNQIRSKEARDKGTEPISNGGAEEEGRIPSSAADDGALRTEEESEVEVDSDETLYRINGIAFNGDLLCLPGDENDEALSQYAGNRNSEVANHNEEDRRTFTEKTLQEGDTDSVELWEDDCICEHSESKKVWDKGGFFFDSNDEEEVIARLVDQKGGGKKRIEQRKQKQRQRRRALCIQGRTLATRKLSLGTKLKSK